MVKDGIGEIIFTEITFGNESSSVTVGLQDSKGVTLGTYQKVGENIKITDILKDASQFDYKEADSLLAKIPADKRSK